MVVTTGGSTTGGTSDGGTTGGTVDLEECEYYFHLTDSFGDGWDNSYLDVYMDGTSLGTYTNTGLTPTPSSATEYTVDYAVTVEDGATLEWTYYAGSQYEKEISYQVYDSDNNLIYEEEEPAEQTSNVVVECGTSGTSDGGSTDGGTTTGGSTDGGVVDIECIPTCASNQECFSGVCVGTGDITVTLQWNTDADLDLYMVEPLISRHPLISLEKNHLSLTMILQHPQMEVTWM